MGERGVERCSNAVMILFDPDPSLGKNSRDANDLLRLQP